ncbi:MAG: TonB family protein, partial [Saprospiraceae bacterium]
AERDAPHSAPPPQARSAEPAPGAISLQDDALAAAAETLTEETAPAPSADKAEQDAEPSWAETATSVQQQPSPSKPAAPALNQAKEKTARDELAKPAVWERKKIEGSGTPQQPGPTDLALSATPSGGWAAFQAYLRDNARLTTAARNNNITGNVRLSFSIGTDGKPANVRVLQSLGHGCDEEAERLVRRFDWTPAGTVGVEVEVPFRR